MHGKVSTIHFESHPIFDGLSEAFPAMRYHSLVVEEREETPMKIIAQTEQAEVMAIAHDRLPIAGFQFHPESILTQTGLLLLKNWFTYIRE